MKNLIEVFQDTQEVIKWIPSRSNTTKHTMREIAICYRKPGLGSQRVKVVNMDSVSAVQKYYKLGKTAVLNMASWKRPGGGVANGARAQEECLFRCSDLSRAISTDFYPLGESECLYTTDGLFIKDCNYDPIHPIECDVITIPAINLSPTRHRGTTLNQKPDGYIETTMDKIRLMLSIPEKHRVENIILGAWGCGVFGNDPQEMAEMFREVIEEGYGSTYKEIVFAIINDHNSVGNNYSIFKQELDSL